MFSSFKSLLFLSVVLISSSFQDVETGSIYMTKSGYIKFTSEAPLETIEAENNNVSAVIDISKKQLAFKVPITSFLGFNSPLQQEHFNENYMEVDAYPQATFTGKIIEDVDFNTNGTYKVRTKGMLNIHGSEKERIIAGMVKVNGDKITVTSNFDVPLSDHDISIPKIVNQKIADIIQVEFKSDLVRK